MSEAEDIRAVVGNHDFQNIIEAESGRSSSVDYLDTYEDVPKETAKDLQEEDLFAVDKDKETFVRNDLKPIEKEKKEIKEAACSSSGDKEEGNIARREESVTRIGTATGTIIDGRNENVPVGEWNSLPLLVERLRATLELSLGSRRDDEQPQTLEDSGVDSEEDFRIRNSMEQVLGNCKEAELKRDLKFLEDLLLSDIRTALSKLRETLERIDVAALAKHGAASDPSSKLQLLRLVSSLLSRLQIPREVTEKIPVLPSTSLSRRRRGSRHTIGVSAEELAEARKWLEEERNCLPVREVVPVSKEKRDQSLPSNGHNAVVERKPEEIRDKCIKDAINQRQLLEDKNKEIRDNCALRGVQLVTDDKAEEESGMCQARYRANNYIDTENDNEKNGEEAEERSRVSKLAAVLRQRAESSASGGGKYIGNNKFSAKKSKIKRANTIDIPSYLKLQAESLGHESTGCVSLRKPINVGDKSFNSTNVTVPSFQPKTENDRKFLALINKNNEASIAAPVVPFKTFSHVKNMDMSSLTNENWNSRFSNIKTAFDKPSTVEDRDDKSSLKVRANKMFPGAGQTSVYSAPSVNYVPPVSKIDPNAGFRHAPSSPFRKIEKSPGSPSKTPLSYHWPKNPPAPTNTLKEKARKMFDRENVQPSARSFKSDLDKHTFPRPPWIDHERNENKSNGTVTENGKLDYRSFCKQFAPFVGKPPPIESKRSEEHRQRGRMSGIVDGKISFKMAPDTRVQTRHYPPVEYRDPRGKVETVRSVRDDGYNYADATLKGSSSVAVQTGINDDDHQDEERCFRVVPKISKGTSVICNNAAVQTSGETVPTNDLELLKQWRPPSYQQPDINKAIEDRQWLLLDHNQNYHTVPSDPEYTNNENLETYQKQTDDPLKNYRPLATDKQDSSAIVSSALPDYRRLDGNLNKTEGKASEWTTDNVSFADDQNIQNQDISPDVGVVTRYTCAIATVASSVDSPEPRSEEVAIDSRTSSSPSPSLSYSRSRPPTNETVASEEEIRRHNLLQQSLVRRLQNEITSLNDPPQPHQPSNFGPYLTVEQSHPKSSSQSPSFVQSYTQPTNIPSSHHQQNYAQSTSILSSHQPNVQPRNIHQPLTTPVHRSQNYNQPANFDQPSGSQVSNRFGKYLTPIPQKKPQPPRTHSPVPIPANRVGTLRDAYEQSPNSQVKSVHKERSPVSNGVVPIDSSDEYLVSCATKPTRSIVLSKSESWHQLALSNNHPRTTNVVSSTKTTSSYSHGFSHPKPPKPRSPSSQKLRSKQFEASSMADSVKKMEDKIRQYFDHPSEPVESKDSVKHRRSPRFGSKGMVVLSRSRTMPGLTDDKLRLSIPTQQVPLLNVNTADVDKVFDDLFEEATRIDKQ